MKICLLEFILFSCVARFSQIKSKPTSEQEPWPVCTFGLYLSGCRTTLWIRVLHHICQVPHTAIRSMLDGNDKPCSTCLAPRREDTCPFSWLKKLCSFDLPRQHSGVLNFSEVDELISTRRDLAADAKCRIDIVTL